MTTPDEQARLERLERYERIQRERFVLELRRNEITPTQVGGATVPPFADAGRFTLRLRAARFWRDLRRQRR